ncbi:thiolase family protein [Cupriavidus alkaliphilus]|uniref:thiolase family protein n=1 Tax=Cupriavidus alkaliphilus TaxID=942866 RepID=UPI000DC38EBC|nr:thiolase family protein [Cupriavidus alkaliphilus]RAR99223.1 acetyl-CoA C-acetyltransferase/acetyl-CoA acyltransferase [Cupriavidus alkaliphilus]
MQQAVIVDAIRSPMGRSKPGSAFTELHATELLAQVLKALVERNRLDPGLVDDVITGCVTQAGEQSAGPGRVAWLAAGFPEHVPATTIDRKCGSSQQAVHFAAQGIMAGAYDIVIACGIESMSRVPMGSARIGQNPYGPSMEARYAPGLVSQGVAAELVAAKYELSRGQMDSYSARSHELAAAARESGAFRREIVGISTPNGVVEHDETIRPGTSVEKLGTLQASFRNDELSARFPQIGWNVTAGNASQISDGAAAMLLMSEAMAQRLGLKPRARFAAFDVCGDDPIAMLTAPIPASQRALRKSGLTLEQIDHYEINEAFACVPLAWQRALGADPARLNPRGGAIALGHPLGASGVRLMTTMLHALEDSGQRYGLQSMCEAGGMANATIIERL